MRAAVRLRPLGSQAARPWEDRQKPAACPALLRLHGRGNGSDFCKVQGSPTAWPPCLTSPVDDQRHKDTVTRREKLFPLHWWQRMNGGVRSHVRRALGVAWPETPLQLLHVDVSEGSPCFSRWAAGWGVAGTLHVFPPLL